jgi:hypothetical protein
MRDKEKIYDEKINPLMAQIIEICKENDIQTLCTFGLNNDGLICTTYLPSKEPNREIADATKVIQHGYVVEKPWFATTVTRESEVSE